MIWCPMPVKVEQVSDEQAAKIALVAEGEFADVKAIEIEPSKLSRTIAAFANNDGGDLYVGIDESGVSKNRVWRGFANIEAANAHLQVFEQLFPLGTDFQYEFLQCDTLPGLVLHIQVNKTQSVVKASNGIIYLRRGAQSLSIVDAESIRRLEYRKGIASFETELTNAPKEMVTTSDVVAFFIREIIPTAQPEAWLRKQMLIREEAPTVAGTLLFADEPQAYLAKRCGVKISRFKTREAEGFREAMAFTPRTVEGSLYYQIKDAVRLTTEITETIPRLGDGSLESVKYPNVTLHEIITNAVLHRDYSVADDVHIRIFDDRIEVQSPGRLPAHITVENILSERFARNGSIVRVLNKFPDPPNKDIGEGLNTAFNAMHEIGFKEPTIAESGNSVVVTIKHELLASPEEAIMDYLETHATIQNRVAREITHVRRDHQIKAIFNRMVRSGLIEQVPGTRTSNTSYRRKVRTREATAQADGVGVMHADAIVRSK